MHQSYYPGHSGGSNNPHIIEMLERRISALEAELEYIKKAHIQSHESFNIMICDIKKQRENDNNALSLLMASRMPEPAPSHSVHKKGVRLIETDSDSDSSEEDNDTNSIISRASSKSSAAVANNNNNNTMLQQQSIIPQKQISNNLSSMAKLSRDRRRAIL